MRLPRWLPYFAPGLEAFKGFEGFEEFEEFKAFKHVGNQGERTLWAIGYRLSAISYQQS